MYTERHNVVAGIVYKNICAAYGLEVSSFQWQTPPKVVENYTVKVLWVFKFQTDKQLAKHSDIMVDQKARKTAACDLIWVET